jgi:hypothetical protein
MGKKGKERCDTERRKNMGENRGGGVLRTTTLMDRF